MSAVWYRTLTLAPSVVRAKAAWLQCHDDEPSFTTCSPDSPHRDVIDHFKAGVEHELARICGGAQCHLTRAQFCLHTLDSFISGPSVESVVARIVSTTAASAT